MTLFAGVSRSLWCRLGWHSWQWSCTCSHLCIRCGRFKVNPELSVECDARSNRMRERIDAKLSP
jgi:hypothetical protein